MCGKNLLIGLKLADTLPRGGPKVYALSESEVSPHTQKKRTVTNGFVPAIHVEWIMCWQKQLPVQPEQRWVRKVTAKCYYCIYLSLNNFAIQTQNSYLSICLTLSPNNGEMWNEPQPIRHACFLPIHITYKWQRRQRPSVQNIIPILCSKFIGAAITRFSMKEN